MTKVWEARYGRYEARLAPQSAGFVLVLFVIESPDLPTDPRAFEGQVPLDPAVPSAGRAARVFYFGDDTETWAAALSDLLREDPTRMDVWAFSAGAPVNPRLRLET